MGAAMARKRVRGPVVPKRDHKMSGSGQDKLKSGGYGVRARLTELIEKTDISAMARVSAARTLAEMDGMIGKHQAAPSSVPTAPIASLSRDQLVRELERLRGLVSLGLVP